MTLTVGKHIKLRTAVCAILVAAVRKKTVEGGHVNLLCLQLNYSPANLL